MDLFLQTFTCPASPPPFCFPLHLPPFELNARFAANFMCLFANANAECGCGCECGLRCEYFSGGFVTGCLPHASCLMPLASWRNCCKVNRKLAASVVCKRGQSCNVQREQRATCNAGQTFSCNVPLLKPCGKCQVHFAARKSLSRSRSLLSLSLPHCLPHGAHSTPVAAGSSDTFLARSS